jgi:hypothetical protein
MLWLEKMASTDPLVVCAAAEARAAANRPVILAHELTPTSR